MFSNVRTPLSLHERVRYSEKKVMTEMAACIYAGNFLPDAFQLSLATEYMDLIGFGSQPYLVYRHFDAPHPHIHLVSTNIQPDGSRINMNYLLNDKSRPS